MEEGGIRIFAIDLHLALPYYLTNTKKVPSLANAIMLNVSIYVNLFLFEREGWGESECVRDRDRGVVVGEVQYPSLLC